MQRLLRALHLSRRTFDWLEASGAPNTKATTELGLGASGAFVLPALSGPASSLGLCLSRQIGPPPCLSLRLNTLHPNSPWPWDIEEALAQLRSVLGPEASFRPHATWPDVITVTTQPPKGFDPEPKYPTVLTTARAGEAVLRGRHLVAKDIFATVPDAPKIRKGSAVSVFAAARDVQDEGHSSQEPVNAELGAEGMAASAAVERLVHTRYARGADGPAIDAIFIGNGTWLPPFGVRMSSGFLRPMPLPNKGDTRIIRHKGNVITPGGAAYHQGLAERGTKLPDGFLPQSLPSVTAIHILNPQPGEHVLDLCAAPGGKTHHAAQLMRNTGSIVAVEASEVRYHRMRKFLVDAGASIVTCVHADGTQFNGASNGQSFDRVLVDAPCSSSGLWPRLDWKRVTQEGVEKLAQQQFALLATAVREVKVGGTVVYSVCSYLPQETVEVCKRALQELPLELDTANGDSSHSQEGITADCDAMGFFVIRFRRLPGSLVTHVRRGGARRRVKR